MPPPPLSNGNSGGQKRCVWSRRMLELTKFSCGAHSTERTYSLDQLITHITERTGITADQAREVVQVITSYMKDKLPAPMAAQMDGLLRGADDSPTRTAAGSADKPWTSGEVVGEGQGEGPRKDTGTYDARQWVGEGQGDRPAIDEPPKRSD